MYDGPVQDLIDELGRLPGVGPKSAQRIAFWLLEQPQADIERLATVLMTVKEHTRMCSVCFNVTDEQTCRICRDPRRDRSLICVVEESKDVVAIERTREFHGLYHVLGGSISPIDGRGPGDLRIAELVRRLSDPRRSSSPPTRTSRARPPPPTSRACSPTPRASGSASWPPACRWAATSSTPTT